MSANTTGRRVCKFCEDPHGRWCRQRCRAGAPEPSGRRSRARRARATRAPALGIETAPRNDRDGELGARLIDRWELDPGQTGGTFLPRPHKPVYVLRVAFASRVNRKPTRANPCLSTSR